MNDTPQRYGTLSRLLHWSMAVLVGWQLLKIFDRINDGEHWVGQTLVPWHVSIGALIMLLVIVRLVWAIKQKDNRPRSEPVALVKAGHGLLYLGMLVLPITGVMYLVGKGYGLKVFGMQLIARGEGVEWMASLGSLHSPIAWLLLLLIAGHMGMALLHHWVKKDDTLKRML